MAFLEDDTEQLLRRVRRDEANAVSDLLNLHQEQLRKAIVASMDHRLQGRIDASDVIQDTMIEASRRLTEYLENPAIPFYPWLRAIAMNRLTDLYRRHILSQKRSIDREAAIDAQMSDQSVYELARQLAAPGNTPSEEARAKESQQIIGIVWQDFNNDGLVNFGENAIDNVAITLTGIDDRGNAANLGDDTDVDGIYAYFDLRPGEYTISETQPAGFDDGLDVLGTVNGAPLGDNSENDVFSDLVLPPGAVGDTTSASAHPPAAKSFQARRPRSDSGRIAKEKNCSNRSTADRARPSLASGLPRVFPISTARRPGRTTSAASPTSGSPTSIATSSAVKRRKPRHSGWADR